MVVTLLIALASATASVLRITVDSTSVELGILAVTILYAVMFLLTLLPVIGARKRKEKVKNVKDEPTQIANETAHEVKKAKEEKQAEEEIEQEITV
jgi:hypothetical protein